MKLKADYSLDGSSNPLEEAGVRRLMEDLHEVEGMTPDEVEQRIEGILGEKENVERIANSPFLRSFRAAADGKVVLA